MAPRSRTGISSEFFMAWKRSEKLCFSDNQNVHFLVYEETKVYTFGDSSYHHRSGEDTDRERCAMLACGGKMRMAAMH